MGEPLKRQAAYRRYNLACRSCRQFFSEDSLVCPACGHDNFEGDGGPGSHALLLWIALLLVLGSGAAAVLWIGREALFG